MTYRNLFSITTPDQVVLKLEIAGMGTRFIAGLIDTLILLFLIVASFPLFAIDVFGTAMAVIYIFTVVWGYPVLLEALKQGQTFGKMAMGIQVVTDQGHFISWKAAALRSLLRLIDGMPGFSYLVGGITMGIDPSFRRLGDIAAGTLVVKKGLANSASDFGASWISRLEKGQMPQAFRLPFGSLNAKQLGLIVTFMERRESLPKARREELAKSIATPITPLMGAECNNRTSESILEQIYDKLSTVSEPRSFEKLTLWKEFETRCQSLKKRHLRSLSADEMEQLIYNHRQIVTDLSRATAMGADKGTLERLNGLALMGHQLLNHPYHERTQNQRNFLFRLTDPVTHFPRAFILSFFLLFGPAVISYFAIQWYPELAPGLVSEAFYDFEPANVDNIHDIPPLSRPVAASQIITNNIQVTFGAFTLGLTAGIGTFFILIQNGVHLGAVMSWLTLQGHGRAFWGWIMPHAATELLAIVLSGAAGLILADAILRPGRRTRKEALKAVAKEALMIEVIAIFMLLIAGMIEGFISPSNLPFSARIIVLIVSTLFWFSYIFLSPKKDKLPARIEDPPPLN